MAWWFATKRCITPMDKDHTAVLEPNATDALIQEMADAPRGEAQQLRCGEVRLRGTAPPGHPAGPLPGHSATRLLQDPPVESTTPPG